MGRLQNALRVQFSLRTLLGAMLLACLFLTLAILADFRLTFGRFVHIRCEKGRLTFCDALENGISLDGWGDLSTHSPPVSVDIGTSAGGFETWGFGMRYVKFSDDFTVWYVHLPLLVFLVLFTVFVVFCVNLVRKTRRARQG